MKAEDTTHIDLRGKTTIADTMVVTSGRSNRHVGAVADRVLEDLRKAGVPNLRVEGMPHCDWVLIDAGDVIVHVFRPEVRAFYSLEKMWEPGSTRGKRAELTSAHVVRRNSDLLGCRDADCRRGSRTAQARARSSSSPSAIASAR